MKDQERDAQSSVQESCLPSGESCPESEPENWVRLTEAIARTLSARAQKLLPNGLVYRWIHSGRLPAIKRSGEWFINPDDLRALLALDSQAKRRPPFVKAPPILAKQTPTTADNELTNWISLAEAAARMPSPIAGGTTQAKTVLRLARKQGLEIRKRGWYSFVYWPDIVQLMVPVQTPVPAEKLKTSLVRRKLDHQTQLQSKLEELGLA